jgi:DNA-binding response OmpR family regulator
MERIRVFQLGADDYLAKPYFTSELIFRINNSLKRQYRIEENKQLIKFGPLHLDRSNGRTFLEGKELFLSELESEILFVLVSNSGKPLDRKSIYKSVMGFELDCSTRNMDVKIAHLRKKLGNWHSMIRTVWGVGYEIVILEIK